MNFKKQKTSTLLFLWSMILLASCNESISSSRSTDESANMDTLYIHNKIAGGKTNWSFNINNQKYYPLPRNKEMFLKIDLIGEYAQLKKRTSIHITPIDSNCRVTKINNQRFKVFIQDNFSSDFLKLKIEASPNKNITVINTQHQMTYNFQDKFFLSQINNEVVKKCP